MKKKSLHIFLFVFLLTLGLFFGSGFIVQPKDNAIHAVSRYGTSHVPRLKGEELRWAKIEIVYKDKTFVYQDDFITPTDHLVAQQIFNRRINHNHKEKLEMVNRSLSIGASFKDALLYSYPLLPKKIDSVIKEITREPVNSKIYFHPDKKPSFHVTREEKGYAVDEARLYQDIYYALRLDSNAKVFVTPRMIEPCVTSFDNMRLTHLRAKFKTTYENSGAGRVHNIRLAMEKINGTRLESGEEFSFNKTVGQRTAEKGFKSAKIIMDGEYVDGIGGGVCQASTTLYNAAIRADMEITQVRNHSLISSYVSPSFDAMVNSGSADLIFKNTGKTPVFIKAYGTNTYCVVEFYGEELPYEIKTKSVVTHRGGKPKDEEIVDFERKYVSSEAMTGERVRVKNGQSKLTSEGYLQYFDDSGNLIESKLIRKDRYLEKKGLVAIAPPLTEKEQQEKEKLRLEKERQERVKVQSERFGFDSKNISNIG
ncbi:MAG: VanW family protein [Firmicutes bacterium]|nr:VanW family protein [Bacillota bacterium]MCL2256476.1 VanW family protein [Bacillota bacterium]